MKKTLTILALAVSLSWASLSSSNTIRDRFFLSGDGVIHLINARTKAGIKVRYRLPDGTYPEKAHQEINRFFGLPADSRESISLRLISLLNHIEDVTHRPLSILSGYRSLEYNDSLRKEGRLAARTSLHIEGMAADIRIPKTQAAEIFETIKSWKCCGVGYYHTDSLHVDTGPARYWDETSSKVKTDISSHNKVVMTRTDFDIYKPGETVAIKIARITDYPIGLNPEIEVIAEKGPPSRFPLDSSISPVSKACRPVADPLNRTFFWTIPENFHSEGKLKIRLSFCDKPFSEMPSQIESNLFVVEMIPHL